MLLSQSMDTTNLHSLPSSERERVGEEEEEEDKPLIR